MSNIIAIKKNIYQEMCGSFILVCETVTLGKIEPLTVDTDALPKLLNAEYYLNTCRHDQFTL